MLVIVISRGTESSIVHQRPTRAAMPSTVPSAHGGRSFTLPAAVRRPEVHRSHRPYAAQDLVPGADAGEHQSPGGGIDADGEDPVPAGGGTGSGLGILGVVAGPGAGMRRRAAIPRKYTTT